MSVLRPVGPLPARVYWVRRVLIAALVVLALLIASWAWGAATGGSDGSGASPGQSPAGSPGVSPSTTLSPSPSTTVSPTPTPSATKSTSGTPQCADSAISVVATPSKTTYPADQDPHFTIKVTNTSKKTCSRDVGQKAMEVKVSKGDTLIWSSDHCAPGGSAKVVKLDAGESYTTSVVWARTESKKGCPDNEPDAPAGTYALTGRNLSVTSQPAAFALA